MLPSLRVAATASFVYWQDQMEIEEIEAPSRERRRIIRRSAKEEEKSGQLCSLCLSILLIYLSLLGVTTSSSS